jgi:hypothetical protein
MIVVCRIGDKMAVESPFLRSCGDKPMPIGKVHAWFCKQWGIQCPFPSNRKCPLDEGQAADGQEWHTKHDVNRIAVAEFAKIERTPTLLGCETWTKAIMEKMEPYFDEFRSQFPKVAVDQVRRCWTAHLVADYACRYWYDGTNQQVRTYGEIKDDRFWEFVTDVGRRLLDEVQHQ